MQQCPHCSFDLSRPGSHRTSRRSAGTGGKSLAAELVTCPDCGRVIDGFAAH